MTERWTKERRLEHTRGLLVDAAEDVFARKGFSAASLDDIAAAAGYTRGAIYVHFKTKEDLFFAVSDRYWRRYFDTFTEELAAVGHIGERELEEIAQRWVQLSRTGGAQHAALGYEFTLYLLRNPEARERVAEKRRKVVDELTAFVITGSKRLGLALSVPPRDFAQVLIATTDGIMLAGELGDADLYRTVLKMYTSVIVPNA
ncbi:TetR/AcrR family transcriptional regulator [Mycolicibacterium sp. XJ870]